MMQRQERKVMVTGPAVIARWAEWCNDARPIGIGPKQVSAPLPTGEPDDLYENGLSLRCWERVEQCLTGVGKGVYYPARLRELLMHMHYRGETIESFMLFGPGKGVPKEVLQLGFRSNDLLTIAYKKFLKGIGTVEFVL